MTKFEKMRAANIFIVQNPELTEGMNWMQVADEYGDLFQFRAIVLNQAFKDVGRAISKQIGVESPPKPLFRMDCQGRAIDYDKRR